MEPLVRKPKSIPVPDGGGKTDLKDLSASDLEKFVVEQGLPRFRAKQVYHWLHVKNAQSLSEMKNLGAKVQEILGDTAYVGGLVLTEVLTSNDGTRKLLLDTVDGHQLETVLIPAEDRLTQCISSQVGCRIGCTFCLTATMPVRRNLSVSEILDQVYQARRILESEGRRITNLVYMGMGEPLDNLEAVVASCERLNDSEGFGMSPRRITISTSGLIPGIQELGDRLNVNMAISLNASNDTVRDQVIPINRKYPIEELVKVMRDWPRDRRQKVTVEYVLLGGVNDRLEHANELITLLRRMEIRINLIPFNPYPGALFERPTDVDVSRFGRALRDAGYRVTVRQSRGSDIGAACGMLDGKKGVVQEEPESPELP